MNTFSAQYKKKIREGGEEREALEGLFKGRLNQGLREQPPLLLLLFFFVLGGRPFYEKGLSSRGVPRLSFVGQSEQTANTMLQEC